MKTEIIPAQNQMVLQHALDIFNHGGLVAFPTDTVYGVAAPMMDKESIERLYVIKGRTSAKAIAILIGKTSDLPLVAESYHSMVEIFASEFWPGPLTIVLPKHPDIPDILSPLPTIGVRVPDHPVALSLLEVTGPLAVTSANLSGRPAAVTAEQVMEQLGNRIHLIIDGGSAPGRIPSTVVDCTSNTPVIVREGPITLDHLLTTLKK